MENKGNASSSGGRLLRPRRANAEERGKERKVFVENVTCRLSAAATEGPKTDI